MVEDRWVHAGKRLTITEFSFDPCNIYRDGPRGVGYPADACSVGDIAILLVLCCPVLVFFSGTRPGLTPGWIFMVDSSNDAFSPKDVPFGGQINES